MTASASRLQPRADGLLAAEALPEFPFRAACLQGELAGLGDVRLARWGVGEVGRFSLEGFEGPFLVAPNRVEGAAGSGFFVAQSAPVIALRGARPVKVRQEGSGRVIVEPRGQDWVIAVGADEAEARAALALDVPAVIDEAARYVARCDLLPAADPLLRSLVMHGVHAALSSVSRYPDGAFAGLAAGLAYSSPARTYYRDSYWTLPALLRLAPEVVPEEIELLAAQVQPTGEAPSGVILAGPHAREFERRRLDELAMAAVHWRPGDWWSDHFDSPLFFVLAIGDHAAATGDTTLAHKHWPRLRAIFERYRSFQGFQGLPVKPRNDRDWADNVFRAGIVAYDSGLWVGALDALARLGAQLDPALADEAQLEARRARASIDRALWLGHWYADYERPDGTLEQHLALDSLTLLRFDAVPKTQAEQVLAEVRQRLESRRNPHQPCGEFGMLSVYPPFARRDELRGKSAFPYRYHNGGDWPWLDGLYAGERLRRGLSGWRYPLTRWWSSCLEHGWAGAVEHFSPAYGRGSLLQAWSSLPAAVALSYAEQMRAGDPDDPSTS